MPIHKTADVAKKAKLGKGVSIGAYAVVGPDVTIGAGTEIGEHCVITGDTAIGQRCRIFSGAVVGSSPQDLKYKGQRSRLEIGDNNIIREYCTLNPGSEEGTITFVGNKNLFMAYSHIAHDCRVGNECVFANNATLAGHVTVEDKAVIGGLVAVHQFVRVGRLSIIGGCSKVVQDIPPYSTCDGHPARVYGLNLVGLRRNKFSKDDIMSLDKAFRILFSSGLTLKNAAEALEKQAGLNNEVSYLLDFIRHSQRGISRSCRKEK
jgi:UDP-N-acetylglucosamine acyltransferase